MSNINTNIIMNILQGVLQKKNPMSAGFITIHIGTDNLPVRILEIAPINDKS